MSVTSIIFSLLIQTCESKSKPGSTSSQNREPGFPALNPLVKSQILIIWISNSRGVILQKYSKKNPFSNLSYVMKRTLVFPPPHGWYLIDWGPRQRMKSKDQSGLSDYPDYFYKPHMDIGLPSISTEEYLRREGKNMSKFFPLVFRHLQLKKLFSLKIRGCSRFLLKSREGSKFVFMLRRSR